MTVCNMSIEAGARAGMIAPDDTTFAYLEGRPGAPAGRRLGAGARRLARAASDAGRRLRPRGRDRRRRARAAGDLGDEPGDGRAGRRAGPGPGGASTIPTTAKPPSARSRTWRSSRARRSREIARRPRLHRLVHERADRGPARRRRDRRAGEQVAPVACARWSCRARRAVRRQAEEEGLDEVFQRGRLRVAPGRLLDVPRHEPGHARARASAAPRPRTATSRAARASGGRTHLVSPAMAAAAALAGHFVDVREVSAAMKALRAVDRARRRARPRRRRHRPDHPEAVPEADRAHRLRRVPLLRLAQGSRVRAEPAGVRGRVDPRRRAQLRLRLLARARGLGAPGLRLRGRHRAVVRRHLRHQLRRRSVCSRSPCPRSRCASWRRRAS